MNIDLLYMKPGGDTAYMTRYHTMKSVWLGMLAISAVLGLALAVFMVVVRPCPWGKKALPQDLAQGYVGVFLDNGQVYFGQAKDMTPDFFTLDNIYYLQSNKPTDSENQSDLKLIKMGNELHGPKDMMQINRQHVLFIESLKDDSKVVEAIKNYKQ